MLMWHSVMWQVFWRLDQEEKVFDALIKRNNQLIEQQREKEKEQDQSRVMTEVLPIVYESRASNETDSEQDMSIEPYNLNITGNLNDKNDIERMLNM